MLEKNYKIINIVFYGLMFYSTFLVLLPKKLTWGVYTPNVLGWSMILAALSTFIVYLVLLLTDLKSERSKKGLVIRSLILFSITAVLIMIWFYQANRLGNI